MRKNPKGDWKANQFDWDRISSLSQAECCFSLSQQEVALILTYTEMIGYVTRWFSETDETVNASDIVLWRSNLERKLMSGCCPDEGKIYRVGEDGQIQSSTDGGITWEDDPAADPRLTAPRFPPLPGEDGNVKKCTAANNAAGQIKIAADQLIADSGAWAGLTALIGILLGVLAFLSIIGSGGILTPFVVTLAGTLLGAGSAAFNAAMTEDVYNRLVCTFYCNMQEDGSFTEGNLADIHDALQTTETGIAQEYLEELINMIGSVGLTNMGRTSGGSVSYDCAECDCGEGCGYKYELFDQPGYPAVPGVIVAQTDTYIDLQIGATSYGLLQAIDISDCCFVGPLEVISGSATGVAYVDCPNPFTGTWAEGSPSGRCCSFIQCQGSPGSVIRIPLGPCA